MTLFMILVAFVLWGLFYGEIIEALEPVVEGVGKVWNWMPLETRLVLAAVAIMIVAVQFWNA